MKTNFKKIIAIVLVIANVIASSGFSVLASSVGNIVDSEREKEEEVKNYYYLYEEEHVERSIFVDGGKEIELDEDTFNKKEEDEVPAADTSTDFVEDAEENTSDEESEDISVSENDEEPEEDVFEVEEVVTEEEKAEAEKIEENNEDEEVVDASLSEIEDFDGEEDLVVDETTPSDAIEDSEETVENTDTPEVATDSDISMSTESDVENKEVVEDTKAIIWKIKSINLATCSAIKVSAENTEDQNKSKLATMAEVVVVNSRGEEKTINVKLKWKLVEKVEVKEKIASNDENIKKIAEKKYNEIIGKEEVSEEVTNFADTEEKELDEISSEGVEILSGEFDDNKDSKVEKIQVYELDLSNLGDEILDEVKKIEEEEKKEEEPKKLFGINLPSVFNGNIEEATESEVKEEENEEVLFDGEDLPPIFMMFAGLGSPFNGNASHSGSGQAHNEDHDIKSKFDDSLQDDDYISTLTDNTWELISEAKDKSGASITEFDDIKMISTLSGSFYIDYEDNYTINHRWDVPEGETLNICLNGKNLIFATCGQITGKGNVNICNCGADGYITSKEERNVLDAFYASTSDTYVKYNEHALIHAGKIAIVGVDFNKDDSKIVINNSYVDDGIVNTSGDGSVVWADTKVVVDKTKFNNVYSFNTNGAAINAMRAELKVLNTEFNKIYNLTSNGGAIAFDTTNAPILSKTIFKECYAGKEGGALYGKNISGEADSPLEIAECTFEECFAGMSGGAIYVDSVDEMIIDGKENADSYFKGNQAGISGGAIYVEQANNFVVKDFASAFENNNVGENNILNYKVKYPTIENPDHNENLGELDIDEVKKDKTDIEVPNYGGAIYLSDEVNEAVINNCSVFKGNKAEGINIADYAVSDPFPASLDGNVESYGGAIYAECSTSLKIDKTSFGTSDVADSNIAYTGATICFNSTGKIEMDMNAANIYNGHSSNGENSTGTCGNDVSISPAGGFLYLMNGAEAEISNLNNFGEGNINPIYLDRETTLHMKNSTIKGSDTNIGEYFIGYTNYGTENKEKSIILENVGIEKYKTTGTETSKCVDYSYALNDTKDKIVKSSHKVETLLKLVGTVSIINNKSGSKELDVFIKKAIEDEEGKATSSIVLDISDLKYDSEKKYKIGLYPDIDELNELEKIATTTEIFNAWNVIGAKYLYENTWWTDIFELNNSVNGDKVFKDWKFARDISSYKGGEADDTVYLSKGYHTVKFEVFTDNDSMFDPDDSTKKIEIPEQYYVNENGMAGFFNIVKPAEYIDTKEKGGNALKRKGKTFTGFVAHGFNKESTDYEFGMPYESGKEDRSLGYYDTWNLDSDSPMTRLFFKENTTSIFYAVYTVDGFEAKACGCDNADTCEHGSGTFTDRGGKATNQEYQNYIEVATVAHLFYTYNKKRTQYMLATNSDFVFEVKENLRSYDANPAGNTVSINLSGSLIFNLNGKTFKYNNENGGTVFKTDEKGIASYLDEGFDMCLSNGTITVYKDNTSKGKLVDNETSMLLNKVTIKDIDYSSDDGLDLIYTDTKDSKLYIYDSEITNNKYTGANSDKSNLFASLVSSNIELFNTKVYGNSKFNSVMLLKGDEAGSVIFHNNTNIYANTSLMESAVVIDEARQIFVEGLVKVEKNKTAVGDGNVKFAENSSVVGLKVKNAVKTLASGSVIGINSFNDNYNFFTQWNNIYVDNYGKIDNIKNVSTWSYLPESIFRLDDKSKVIYKSGLNTNPDNGVELYITSKGDTVYATLDYWDEYNTPELFGPHLYQHIKVDSETLLDRVQVNEIYSPKEIQTWEAYIEEGGEKATPWKSKDPVPVIPAGKLEGGKTYKVRLSNQHTHFVCGATLSETSVCYGHLDKDGVTINKHNGTIGDPWYGVVTYDMGENVGSIKNGKSIYLKYDIVINQDLEIAEEKNICLNGHRLLFDGTHKISITGTGKLNICDCKKKGSISEENDTVELNSPAFNLSNSGQPEFNAYRINISTFSKINSSFVNENNKDANLYFDNVKFNKINLSADNSKFIDYIDGSIYLSNITFENNVINSKEAIKFETVNNDINISTLSFINNNVTGQSDVIYLKETAGKNIIIGDVIIKNNTYNSQSLLNILSDIDVKSLQMEENEGSNLTADSYMLYVAENSTFNIGSNSCIKNNKLENKVLSEFPGTGALVKVFGTLNVNGDLEVKGNETIGSAVLGFDNAEDFKVVGKLTFKENKVLDGEVLYLNSSKLTLNNEKEIVFDNNKVSRVDAEYYVGMLLLQGEEDLSDYELTFRNHTISDENTAIINSIKETDNVTFGKVKFEENTVYSAMAFLGEVNFNDTLNIATGNELKKILYLEKADVNFNKEFELKGVKTDSGFDINDTSKVTFNKNVVFKNNDVAINLMQITDSQVVANGKLYINENTITDASNGNAVIIKEDSKLIISTETNIYDNKAGSAQRNVLFDAETVKIEIPEGKKLTDNSKIGVNNSEAVNPEFFTQWNEKYVEKYGYSNTDLTSWGKVVEDIFICDDTDKIVYRRGIANDMSTGAIVDDGKNGIKLCIEKKDDENHALVKFVDEERGKEKLQYVAIDVPTQLDPIKSERFEESSQKWDAFVYSSEPERRDSWALIEKDPPFNKIIHYVNTDDYGKFKAKATYYVKLVQTHAHLVCGSTASECEGHKRATESDVIHNRQIEFNMVDRESDFYFDEHPTATRSFLTKNVLIYSNDLLVDRDAILCLNGYNLQFAPGCGIKIINGAKFIICNCQKYGEITSVDGTNEFTDNIIDLSENTSFEIYKTTFSNISLKENAALIGGKGEVYAGKLGFAKNTSLNSNGLINTTNLSKAFFNDLTFRENKVNKLIGFDIKNGKVPSPTSSIIVEENTLNGSSMIDILAANSEYIHKGKIDFNNNNVLSAAGTLLAFEGKVELKEVSFTENTLSGETSSLFRNRGNGTPYGDEITINEEISMSGNNLAYAGMLLNGDSGVKAVFNEKVKVTLNTGRINGGLFHVENSEVTFNKDLSIEANERTIKASNKSVGLAFTIGKDKSDANAKVSFNGDHTFIRENGLKADGGGAISLLSANEKALEIANDVYIYDNTYGEEKTQQNVIFVTNTKAKINATDKIASSSKIGVLNRAGNNYNFFTQWGGKYIANYNKTDFKFEGKNVWSYLPQHLFVPFFDADEKVYPYIIWKEGTYSEVDNTNINLYFGSTEKDGQMHYAVLDFFDQYNSGSFGDHIYQYVSADNTSDEYKAVKTQVDRFKVAYVGDNQKWDAKVKADGESDIWLVGNDYYVNYDENHILTNDEQYQKTHSNEHYQIRIQETHSHLMCGEKITIDNDACSGHLTKEGMKYHEEADNRTYESVDQAIIDLYVAQGKKIFDATMSYLVSDINIATNTTLSLSGDNYLCLNGHSLILNPGVQFIPDDNAKLTICNCKDSGLITFDGNINKNVFDISGNNATLDIYNVKFEASLKSRINGVAIINVNNSTAKVNIDKSSFSNIVTENDNAKFINQVAGKITLGTVDFHSNLIQNSNFAVDLNNNNGEVFIGTLSFIENACDNFFSVTGGTSADPVHISYIYANKNMYTKDFIRFGNGSDETTINVENDIMYDVNAGSNSSKLLHVAKNASAIVNGNAEFIGNKTSGNLLYLENDSTEKVNFKVNGEYKFEANDIIFGQGALLGFAGYTKIDDKLIFKNHKPDAKGTGGVDGSFIKNYGTGATLIISTRPEIVDNDCANAVIFSLDKAEATIEYINIEGPQWFDTIILSTSSDINIVQALNVDKVEVNYVINANGCKSTDGIKIGNGEFISTAIVGSVINKTALVFENCKDNEIVFDGGVLIIDNRMCADVAATGKFPSILYVNSSKVAFTNGFTSISGNESDKTYGAVYLAGNKKMGTLALNGEVEIFENKVCGSQGKRFKNVVVGAIDSNAGLSYGGIEKIASTSKIGISCLNLNETTSYNKYKFFEDWVEDNIEGLDTKTWDKSKMSYVPSDLFIPEFDDDYNKNYVIAKDDNDYIQIIDKSEAAVVEYRYGAEPGKEPPISIQYFLKGKDVTFDKVMDPALALDKQLLKAYTNDEDETDYEVYSAADIISAKLKKSCVEPDNKVYNVYLVPSFSYRVIYKNTDDLKIDIPVILGPSTEEYEELHDYDVEFNSGTVSEIFGVQEGEENLPEFKGWELLDDEGNVKSLIPEQTPVKNLVDAAGENAYMRASWGDILYKVRYFETKEASEPASVSMILRNTVLTKPRIKEVNIEEREGYAVKLWRYINTVGETDDAECEFGSVKKSFNVYPEWAISHKVTFDANGGAFEKEDPVNIEIQDIAEGAKVELDKLSKLNYEGHDFISWYKKVSSEVYVPFDADTELINEETYLVASWSELIYDIDYDKAGGKWEVEPSELGLDKKLYSKELLLPTPSRLKLTKANSTFTGWKVDGTVMTSIPANKLPKEGRVFKVVAVWKSNYKPTPGPSGGGGGGGGSGGGNHSSIPLPTAGQDLRWIFTYDPVTGNVLDGYGNVVDNKTFGASVTADGRYIDGDGNIHNADGSITAQNGVTFFIDGAMRDIDGIKYYTDGTMELMDGTKILTDGTIIPPSEVKQNEVPALNGSNANQLVNTDVWEYDPETNGWKFSVIDASGEKSYYEKQWVLAYGVNGNPGWYLTGNNGNMVTGWAKKDGEYYYLSTADANKGEALVGTQVIDGLTYQFDLDGKLLVGEKPAMTPIEVIGGTNHTLGVDGTWAVDPITNREMFVEKNGNVAVGWFLVDGDWYYFDTAGRMVTGMIIEGGKKYYLTPDEGANKGKLFAGQVTYGDMVYDFDKATGALKSENSKAMIDFLEAQKALQAAFTSNNPMLDALAVLSQANLNMQATAQPVVQAALPQVALPQVAMPEVAMPEVALPQVALPQVVTEVPNEVDAAAMAAAIEEVLPQDVQEVPQEIDAAAMAATVEAAIQEANRQAGLSLQAQAMAAYEARKAGIRR